MTPHKPIRPFTALTATRQRGMTLIELMVAMVIGLLLALAMVSALVFGEAQRRTTSATSDMDQSGAYAASVLDTALRNTGSGLMSSGMLGCNPGFAGGTGGALPPPFDTLLGSKTNANQLRLAPILIAANPSGVTPGSDMLVVMSASGSAGSVVRTGSVAGNVVTLDNTVGIVSSDDTILQPQVLIGDSVECSMETVTAANAATAALTLSTPPAGSQVNVLPLGNQSSGDIQFQLFGVDSAASTLDSYDLLSNANLVQPLVSNVIAMQALYGVASSASGPLTQWVAPTGTYSIENLLLNPAQLSQIVAIRVALILKGSLYEKTPVTTTKLSWFNADLTGIPYTGLTVPQTWTPSAGDQNYRYRVLEFVVPLRNNSLISQN
jgi:type IV pilus assembly protein PilW